MNPVIGIGIIGFNAIGRSLFDATEISAFARTLCVKKAEIEIFVSKRNVPFVAKNEDVFSCPEVEVVVALEAFLAPDIMSLVALSQKESKPLVLTTLGLPNDFKKSLKALATKAPLYDLVLSRIPYGSSVSSKIAAMALRAVRVARQTPPAYIAYHP